MQFFVKYICRSINLPNHIILMIRSSFILLYILPILLMNKNSMSTQNFSLQFLSSMIAAGTVYLTYTGYQNLPLAIAASIGGLESIFTAFWGLIFREEDKNSFFSLLPIAFLGFISILLFSIDKSTRSEHSGYILGICCMIIANISSSLIGYMVKRLHKTDKTLTIVGYSAIFTSSITSIIVISMSYFGKSFDFARIEPYRIRLGLIGLGGALSSLSSIQSLRHLDPNILISIKNLSISLSLGVGAVIDKEEITRFGLIGILAAFLTLYLMSNRKNLADRIKFWTFISYLLIVGLIFLAIFIRAK